MVMAGVAGGAGGRQVPDGVQPGEEFRIEVPAVLTNLSRHEPFVTPKDGPLCPFAKAWRPAVHGRLCTWPGL